MAAVGEGKAAEALPEPDIHWTRRRHTCLPRTHCLALLFTEIGKDLEIIMQGRDEPLSSKDSNFLLDVNIHPKTRARALMRKIKQRYFEELGRQSVRQRIFFGLRRTKLVEETRNAVTQALQIVNSGQELGGKYFYHSQLHNESATPRVLYQMKQISVILELAACAIDYWDDIRKGEVKPDEPSLWKILSQTPPDWIGIDTEKFDPEARKKMLQSFTEVNKKNMFDPKWLNRHVPFLWLPFIDKVESKHMIERDSANIREEVPLFEAALVKYMSPLQKSVTGEEEAVTECFVVFLTELESLLITWTRMVSETRAKILGLLMTAFVTFMQFWVQRAKHVIRDLEMI